MMRSRGPFAAFDQGQEYLAGDDLALRVGFGFLLLALLALTFLVGLPVLPRFLVTGLELVGVYFGLKRSRVSRFVRYSLVPGV